MNQAGDIIRDNLGQEFCYVPEGHFLGGVEGKMELTIKAPYFLGRSPVTSALFQAFLSDTGHDFSPEDLSMLQEVSPLPECPAVNLSWNDAKEFCRWLRRKTGDYYSLPQNDEWERAARGEDGRIYPWGNTTPSSEHAYFNKSHVGISTQIGNSPKGASPYGCLDMAGNVWEWCLDSIEDARDPHILKGGSWQNEAEHLDAGIKLYSFPATKRRNYAGLRLLYLPGDMLATYQAAYAG